MPGCGTMCGIMQEIGSGRGTMWQYIGYGETWLHNYTATGMIKNIRTIIKNIFSFQSLKHLQWLIHLLFCISTDLGTPSPLFSNKLMLSRLWNPAVFSKSLRSWRSEQNMYKLVPKGYHSIGCNSLLELHVHIITEIHWSYKYSGLYVETSWHQTYTYLHILPTRCPPGWVHLQHLMHNWPLLEYPLLSVQCHFSHQCPYHWMIYHRLLEFFV